MPSTFDNSNPDSRLPVARLLASAVVVLDVMEIRYPLGLGSSVLALSGLVGVLCLSDGNSPLLGMRSSPVNGWRAWVRLGLICSLGIGVALAFYVAIWWIFNWKLPVYRAEPSLHVLFWMCLYAPVVEEITYRSLLAVAIYPSFGERGMIFVSGVVFAWIHVLRGNSSPENLLGGFILAWAFVRSGTILIPLALHSAGNFIAMTGQFVAWYWIPSSG